MEKAKVKKEKFSLFGSRSAHRTPVARPPTSPFFASSSCSSSSSPPPAGVRPGADPRPPRPPRRAADPAHLGSPYAAATSSPAASTAASTLSKAEFLEVVRRSNQACQQGEYALAVRLYGEALAADPQNCILYSNRSAAHLRLGQYDTALDDAVKARLINPKWPKAYFRQGVALQYLGRHADALAAFASGLAQDPKSLQLLVGMVEAAMKSPLRDSIEPTYQKLQKMKLDRSPFVVVSVIGQELVGHGAYGASVVVLEAGLKIGTCSLKLRGSVFSALSSAYWSLGNSEKSMAYMQQDLEVARTLGDQCGECRAHGNLGSAFFSKGNYRESLTNHRNQLVLAMKLKDREAASDALSNLGHVYTSIGDFPNALSSHRQCVLLAQQSRCRLAEARQLGNMGAVYTALGDFANALRCHQQHLDVAKALEDCREEARAYSNLGSAYHAQRDFDKAVSYHTRVLDLARQLDERAFEMRAYAGLGHAARCMQDLARAGEYHQHQLDIAQELEDRPAQGRASSNLGIIHQMSGEYDKALELHKAHLALAQELGDYGAQGRAFGNMGNAYNALGLHDQAVRYHRQELQISLEVNDRPSQASTHGNLAVAYQALGAHDQALQHYLHHLSIARDLGDTQSEARALANLGNFHSGRGEYAQALPFFQQYLSLSPALQDLQTAGKIYHNQGYAYYCLGQYRDAIRCYEQDLGLAKDLQDKLAQTKAYCNLGLAHKALGQYGQAEECQRYLLSLAQALDHAQAAFRALGNLGDLCVCRGDLPGATRFYQQQLKLAQKEKNQKMEADAYSALGSSHRLQRQTEAALSYHGQELSLRRALADQQGECQALGRLAAVHMTLGDYGTTLQCYEAQLVLAQGLRDARLEARVHGNMGITKLNMGRFEEAIGYFEQQLAMLQQLSGAEGVLDRGRAFGSLADCYDALGDFEEAVQYYEKYLSVAQSLVHVQDQEKAYRGLGNAHRSMGNLQQALVCFEKRLVVAHELGGDGGGKAHAYGELGTLHSQLGNYEQALSCLEHQLNIAHTAGDQSLAAEASGSLGGVYQLMGDNETALQWHQRALEIAEQTGCGRGQGRAYGDLGLTYEALGNHERAVFYQEQHLSVAAQTNDLVAKTLAYGSLGRTHHALQNYAQAVMYLQEGLRLAEQLGRREDEAEVRHHLGLSLWASGNLEDAQHQLYRASLLFETIRQETQPSAKNKLCLLELQTSTYQALQRVLVSLGRHDEALATAERGRPRAFVDLLMEHQKGGEQALTSDPYTPVSVEQMLAAVSRQSALVLYYSLAGGFLYSWLLSPGKGIIKFHQVYLGESGGERSEFQEGGASTAGGGVSGTGQSLEQYISNAREALGVESHYSSSIQSSVHSTTASPVRERRGMAVSRPPLRALYDLLIGPMEVGLMSGGSAVGRHRELVLVLEGELYLIPFALLKGSSSNEFLYERFSLISVPSLSSLGAAGQPQQAPPSGPSLSTSDGGSVVAVVGAPLLPSGVMDRWLWGPLPSAQDEALWLGEQLGGAPLTGAAATKERAVALLRQAQCVHFAVHVSWKLAALVLAPGGRPADRAPRGGTGAGGGGGLAGRGGDAGSEDGDSAVSDGDSVADSPALQDFLLTAADILNLSLNVKLVVLRMFPESSSRVTADGVVGLTRALLAAGVQCVCVSQWPVPAAAARLFTQAFYGALLAGTRASAALTDAMKMVQSSPLFSHPTHWAGYMLIGCDVKLNSPKSMIGQALTEILQCPDRARDALRVLLHLVEKSLQRIQSGQCNPMYTSLQSIENKVGGVPGWQALLSAVGFRSEGSLGGGPGGLSATSAVFFPTMDPGNRLQLCSTTLQALLGLPPTALLALCRLVTESESGEQLISKLHQVLAQLQSGDKEQDFSLVPIQVSISVQLWRLPGCHEFLAALGFDLCEVGQEEVVLKTGKQASRRTMHFALNSLLGFFDASELPKRQSMDSSSSLESLSSSQCTTSSLAQSIPPALGCHQSAPPYPDALSCDAISVYSLSSLASSLSFLSRPEPAGSDIISPQDLDRQRAGGVGAAGGGGGRSDGLSLGRLGGRGGAAGGRPGGEEYDGFSIISSEPLRGAAGGGRDCGTLSLPGGHKHSRGGAGRGGASVSSRGSVSTPTSPVKAPSTAMKTSSSPTPGPSLSSPLRKGKLCSSESDQSSTETDSTIKSQEERVPTALLDPQELAQKILQETQSHLEAVDHLQKLSTARGPPCVRPEGKRAARGGSLSSPATAPSSPCRTPTGGGSGRGFCPSVTSAFSRPESRASLRACASPLPPSAPPLTQPPPPPPPPPRPRNTTRLSSCSTSSVSSPDRRSTHSSPAASRSPSLSSSLKDHASLSPLSSPSSPPPPHSEARRAPRWRTSDTSPSCSSADLSLSPLGGAASPIASHSSGGSVSASPSPTARSGPRPRPRGTPPPDDGVPSVRSLKTFWANVSQKAAGSRPERPLAGEDSSRMSVVQQDVLGLLHLSPRQERTAGNRTAGTQASGQGRKAAPLSTSQNPVRKSHDAGSRVNSCPENHPSENGYKVISTGKFYPSSKC